MSAAGFKWVTWNKNKYWYDAALLVFAVLYFYAFTWFAPMFWEGPRIENSIIEIRAFGSLAFIMLTLILCIGPIARLDSRFLPVLYNRRHFGVMTFCVALLHVWAVVQKYHEIGVIDPWVSLVGTMLSGWGSLSAFPLEVFGFIALVIMALMAFTSHDYWMALLDAPVWKAIHMGVYVAYTSLVLHLFVGILQNDQDPILLGLVLLSVGIVVGLHLWTAFREVADDQAGVSGETDWIDACHVSEIPNNRARIIRIREDERVAIFKYDNKLSAISNVCAHQNGPLGEGRIIDGCVTCPWHGFQYLPHNGSSPPPFDEKVPTYRLKLDGNRVLLDPEALPAGTEVEPVVLPVSSETTAKEALA